MGFANMKSAEMSELFYADEIKALRLSLCKKGGATYLKITCTQRISCYLTIVPPIRLPCVKGAVSEAD